MLQENTRALRTLRLFTSDLDSDWSYMKRSEAMNLWQLLEGQKGQYFIILNRVWDQVKQKQRQSGTIMDHVWNLVRLAMGEDEQSAPGAKWEETSRLFYLLAMDHLQKAYESESANFRSEDLGDEALIYFGGES